MLTTVVELPEFIRRATKLLNDSERHKLIFYLSANPKDGDRIQGTGGIRKIRWAREGKGKSGGVRVIYFYYNQSMPLFLITVFAKNEKSNLSKAERNELAKLTKLLVASNKGKDNE